jgi:hypothetical protein
MKSVLLLLLLTSTLLASGCRSLARSAAEEPYRKAMQEGRMSPAEFQQKRDEIRRQSEAKP